MVSMIPFYNTKILKNMLMLIPKQLKYNNQKIIVKKFMEYKVTTKNSNQPKKLP